MPNSIRPRLRLICFIFAFFVGLRVLAALPPSLVEEMSASPACRVQFARCPTVPLLLVEKTVLELLGRKDLKDLSEKIPSVPALEKWSSDLLIKGRQELDQNLAEACRSPRLAFLSRLVRSAFLGKLGLRRAGEADEQTEFLYRGLITQKQDVEILKKRLAALPAGGNSSRARDLLQTLYGGAEWSGGVALVGKLVSPTPTLDEARKSLCPAASCAFWDPRFLQKILVVDEPGLASFLPELAVLVLSSSLLNEKSRIAKIVLAHELAHVAELQAKVLEERDWRREFASFSGWKEPGIWTAPSPKSLGTRDDALVVESARGAFTLVPDFIYGLEKNPKREGFVFAKTFRQTLERGDASEDLADHIAAFAFAPERFCFKKQPLAPGKFLWVGHNVFGLEKELDCSKL